MEFDLRFAFESTTEGITTYGLPRHRCLSQAQNLKSSQSQVNIKSTLAKSELGTPAKKEVHGLVLNVIAHYYHTK